MFSPVTAPVLGFLIFAAGERIPDINPEPSCRSVAARAKAIDHYNACMRLEREARDDLVRYWAEFSADDKATCIQMATLGGNPTHTELHTCLEMKRDARLLREREGRTEIVPDRTALEITPSLALPDHKVQPNPCKPASLLSLQLAHSAAPRSMSMSSSSRRDLRLMYER